MSEEKSGSTEQLYALLGQPQAFDAYLAAKHPDEIVGYATSMCACPIIEWLVEALHIDRIMETGGMNGMPQPKYFISGEHSDYLTSSLKNDRLTLDLRISKETTYVNLPQNHWASRFAVNVDAMKSVGVGKWSIVAADAVAYAGECLVILRSIIAGVEDAPLTEMGISSSDAPETL